MTVILTFVLVIYCLFCIGRIVGGYAADTAAVGLFLGICGTVYLNTAWLDGAVKTVWSIL